MKNNYTYLPDIAADRILLRPDKVDIFGMEFMAEYQFNPIAKAWFSYTYNDARG